jgi:hypothetical protein
MTKLTLLTKINDNNKLKLVGRALNLAFEGLEVEIKILGAVAGGWVQIALSGEDEGIATNYVIKEVGLCPSNFESVKKFSTLKGYIKKIGKNREELSMDVGVFQPKAVYATMPLRRLQDQLVDGRKIALKKIVELFGLDEGLPVSVKVVELNKEKSRIDAELSSKQIRKYGVWRESLLDRLLVLGASLPEVEAAIERAKLKRDVIDVETLGLLEQALTCKLGTDAAGLIPKIGRTLKNARFSVFNPKKVMNFLNLPK